jgi:predicted HicB family RNase H-like nuclease
MSDPTLLIVGSKRPRGRPAGTKSAEPGSSLSAWVPESLHDKAIKVAAAREISLSELIRDALTITIGVDDR